MNDADFNVILDNLKSGDTDEDLFGMAIKELKIRTSDWGSEIYEKYAIDAKIRRKRGLFVETMEENIKDEIKWHKARIKAEEEKYLVNLPGSELVRIIYLKKIKEIEEIIRALTKELPEGSLMDRKMPQVDAQDDVEVPF